VALWNQFSLMAWRLSSYGADKILQLPMNDWLIFELMGCK
jgi:hypothetical protein